jgi:hypothetical protein
MKKISFTLFLAFVMAFSLSTRAIAEDGNIGHGGVSCPPNTACFTEGDIGNGGKTCPPNTTCVTDGDIGHGGRNSVSTQVPAQTDNATIFQTVLDYLSRLFG